MAYYDDAGTYHPDPGWGRWSPESSQLPGGGSQLFADILLGPIAKGTSIDPNNILGTWNAEAAKYGLNDLATTLRSALSRAPAGYVESLLANEGNLKNTVIPAEYVRPDTSATSLFGQLMEMAPALAVAAPAIMGIAGFGGGMFDSIANFAGGSGVNPLAAGGEIPWGATAEAVTGGITPQVGGVSFNSYAPGELGSGTFQSYTPQTLQDILTSASGGPGYGTVNLSPGLAGAAESAAGNIIPGNTWVDIFNVATPGASGGVTEVLKQIANVNPSAASSLAQRLADGSLTSADFAKLAGAILPGLGGYLSSQNQQNKWADFANKLNDQGEWARTMLRESYTNPDSYFAGEGARTTAAAGRTAANALSTTGNPALSPNATSEIERRLTDLNTSGLANYRGGLTSAGYGTSFNAANTATGNAINASKDAANSLGALGSGISDIFNPKPTLADYFKQMMAA